MRRLSPKYPRGIANEASWREGHKKLQCTFAAKRDAERFALKVETARAVGEPTRSMAKNLITVAQVVAASMEAARPKLKPRTFHSYELLYENRFLPKFGSRRASTVTRADLQTWINGLSGEGLAPATVHHHYVALRKVMKHALRDRQIAFNSCDGIDLPEVHDVDESHPGALSCAQVEVLAAELKHFGLYDVLVRLMAYTGLRAGEVAGLRVKDIDLAAGQISVRQTAQWIERKNQAVGEWVLGTPKSKPSSRDVPLLERALIAGLKRLKMQQPPGAPEALFWPGRAPGAHRVEHDRV